MTGYHMLHTLHRLEPGETVLINAIGGGVGLFTTQLAVKAGASVVGTVGTPGKEKRALDYGATRVVITAKEDFEQAVLDFTHGRGVDLAIDFARATMLDRTFNVVRKLGHIISIGEAEGQPFKNIRERILPRRRLSRGFISAISIPVQWPGRMAWSCIGRRSRWLVESADRRRLPDVRGRRDASAYRVAAGRRQASSRHRRLALYQHAVIAMPAYEFIVIGAGIAGASAAYELAKIGSTIILERESQPGYHTTGRSAAVFSEIYGNATIRGLTVGSRGFFASPPAGFCEYPLWKQRHSVMIARSDQLAKLKRAYDEWVKLVPSVRWLEGDEARDVTPMLKPDYVAGGVLEPAANDLDVHEIHRGFLRGAARAGASLVCNAEVLDLSRHGPAWRVRTKSDEFSGNFVINAAGAWGDAIAVLAGAHPIGLAPKRRTAILFDPAPPEDVNGWPIIIDADEQFYFKPDAGRLLGSPADETASPPCDAQPEEIDVALAVDRIEQAATFRVERLVRKWAGLREFRRRQVAGRRARRGAAGLLLAGWARRLRDTNIAGAGPRCRRTHRRRRNARGPAEPWRTSRKPFTGAVTLVLEDTRAGRSHLSADLVLNREGAMRHANRS